jgi:hypothetical protein
MEWEEKGDASWSKAGVLLHGHVCPCSSPTAASQVLRQPSRCMPPSCSTAPSASHSRTPQSLLAGITTKIESGSGENSGWQLGFEERRGGQDWARLGGERME